jgi:hypothetical protein
VSYLILQLLRRQNYPITGLDRPSGLGEVEASRISRHSASEAGKVVAVNICCLVLIFVRDCVDPRAIVRPEGLNQ